MGGVFAPHIVCNSDNTNNPLFQKNLVVIIDK